MTHELLMLCNDGTVVRRAIVGWEGDPPSRDKIHSRPVLADADDWHVKSPPGSRYPFQPTTNAVGFPDGRVVDLERSWPDETAWAAWLYEASMRAFEDALLEPKAKTQGRKPKAGTQGKNPRQKPKGKNPRQKPIGRNPRQKPK